MLYILLNTYSCKMNNMIGIFPYNYQTFPICSLLHALRNKNSHGDITNKDSI